MTIKIFTGIILYFHFEYSFEIRIDFDFRNFSDFSSEANTIGDCEAPVGTLNSNRRPSNSGERRYQNQCDQLKEFFTFRYYEKS